MNCTIPVSRASWFVQMLPASVPTGKLPSPRTLRRMLNRNGYVLRRGSARRCQRRRCRKPMTFVQGPVTADTSADQLEQWWSPLHLGCNSQIVGSLVFFYCPTNRRWQRRPRHVSLTLHCRIQGSLQRIRIRIRAAVLLQTCRSRPHD